MEKLKRKSLSLKEKLDIIDKIERGEKSQREISSERDLSRSTVATIWSTRVKIKSANSIQGRQQGCKRLRQPLYEEVDQALYRWCLYARENNNQTLSTPVLLEKARKFASSLGVENFKCTASWLDRFKLRHGIKFRSVNDEFRAEDSSDHSWFINDLPPILDQTSSPDIYAVNEVGLFYKVLPKESQIMGAGGNIAQSQKVTLLLGANMDGSDRLPPLVIGNSTALSNLQNTDTLSVSYCQNPNSWMTAQIWANWIHLFDQQMYSMRRKVLLFTDACPSHFVVSHLTSVNVHFVPVTCKHFMPMKQGMMQHFKAWYRKLVLRDIVDSINDGVGAQMDILSALHFVRKAWEHISQDCIVNSFKLAGWNHEDYKTIDIISHPVPTIVQECYKLNISESIFEHINQEEERMVTREELTDKIIIESVSAQSDISIYIDDDDESANQTCSPTHNISLNHTPVASEEHTGTKEVPLGISEARAAIETLQSFINTVEMEKNEQLDKMSKMKSKRSLRKKAKVMSLCPEKGVFEIQEMKLDPD